MEFPYEAQAYLAFVKIWGQVDLDLTIRILMYLPRRLKIQAWKQKKMGQRWTHEQAHGWTHGRAVGAETIFLRVKEKREGEIGFCLDNLSYDLDIDFTTKSKLRALKLT